MARTFPAPAAKKPWWPLILAVLSVLAGVVATMYLRSILPSDAKTRGETDFPYEIFIVSIIAVVSFIFGAIEARGILYRPLLMIYSLYFSGVALLGWGQFLPFELVLMPIYAAPGAFFGYVGTLLARRLGRAI